ncbi:pilus-assembly fibrillin subunit [Edwardsiella piscicida]|uniref:pilus-assembly fibrillin subunit n=1 Tax=Edwardsiella piscicida TaxID=1263550 RepID=UPI00370D4448
MQKVTIVLAAVAMLLTLSMNRVLHADEVVTHNNFFIPDESRHQWITEQNGRTGELIVYGTLLSSPCVLETNEVMLPLNSVIQGFTERYSLTLNLLGCGDGGSVVSAGSVAGVNSTLILHSALLIGEDGNALSPELRTIGKGRIWMHGGANQLTYFLTVAQQQVLTHTREELLVSEPESKPVQPLISSRVPARLVQLRLDYE